MKNIVNATDWLVIYRNFVSMVWENNEYSKDEQGDLINNLLNTITDNENSIDIINARNNLKVCLFLLKLNTNQEVATVKSR